MESNHRPQHNPIIKMSALALHVQCPICVRKDCVRFCISLLTLKCWKCHRKPTKHTIRQAIGCCLYLYSLLFVADYCLVAFLGQIAFCSSAVCKSCSKSPQAVRWLLTAFRYGVKGVFNYINQPIPIVKVLWLLGVFLLIFCFSYCINILS